MYLLHYLYKKQLEEVMVNNLFGICKRSKLAKPLEIKNKSGKVLYKVEYQTSCNSDKGSVTVAAGTKQTICRNYE